MEVSSLSSISFFFWSEQGEDQSARGLLQLEGSMNVKQKKEKFILARLSYYILRPRLHPNHVRYGFAKLTFPERGELSPNHWTKMQCPFKKQVERQM